MKILQIPKDEKILRKKSRLLKKREILSKDFRILMSALKYAMLTSQDEVGEDAVGISAIQIGVPIQAFYAENISTGKITLYINPQIKVIDNTPTIMEEGCLSVPGRTGKVLRPKKISITYLDIDAKPHKKILSGFNARVVLHEYDHLQGILFIDKLVE